MDGGDPRDDSDCWLTNEYQTIKLKPASNWWDLYSHVRYLSSRLKITRELSNVVQWFRLRSKWMLILYFPSNGSGVRCDHQPDGVTILWVMGVTTGHGRQATFHNFCKLIYRHKPNKIKSHCIVFLKTLCNKSVFLNLLPVIIVWNNKSLRYDAINL